MNPEWVTKTGLTVLLILLVVSCLKIQAKAIDARLRVGRRCGLSSMVLTWDEMKEGGAVVRATSSNPSIVAVESSKNGVWIRAKKEGTVQVTITANVLENAGFVKRTRTKTIQVIKFQNPYKQLKINGKSYLSDIKNRQSVRHIKVKSSKVKIQFKSRPKSGWNNPSMKVYSSKNGNFQNRKDYVYLDRQMHRKSITKTYSLSPGETLKINLYVRDKEFSYGMDMIDYDFYIKREICKKHKYTTAGGNYCTVCGYEYKPKVSKMSATYYYAVKDKVAVRDNYYAQNSKLVKHLNKDEPVLITGSLVNSVGRTWYVTKEGYYVFSENVTSKQPTRYIITFNANGGTNVPGAVSGYGSVQIPELIPFRTGYTFLGYSTSSTATKAEYLKGQVITPSRNMTLYAVWEKVPNGISDEIQAILDTTKGFPQVKQINDDGSEGLGLCTSAATALMMKRKQIIITNGKTAAFDFLDVRMSLGLSEDDAKAFRGANANWTRPGGFSNLYSGDGSTTFYTSGISVSNIGNTVAERKQKIISLLDKHPEGVVIYCNTNDGVHAVLLTGYDAITNTFYACDSVEVRDAKSQQDKYPRKIEETYLFRACGRSVDNIFQRLTNSGSAGCVWYISSYRLS